jgi:hypothetical protein
MRGRVCCLQLLLVLDSAVTLWSECHGTHDLSVLDSRLSQSGKPSPCIYISQVTHLYPQALGSLFFVSYDPQGYSDIRTVLT